MAGTKSIVTDYKDICFFCGRLAEGEHHLLFGNGTRKLAEEDGLKVPACNQCHTLGTVTGRIHDNVMAEKLSKMLGQAGLYDTLWEILSITIDNRNIIVIFKLFLYLYNNKTGKYRTMEGV